MPAKGPMHAAGLKDIIKNINVMCTFFPYIATMMWLSINAFIKKINVNVHDVYFFLWSYTFTCTCTRMWLSISSWSSYICIIENYGEEAWGNLVLIYVTTDMPWKTSIRDKFLYKYALCLHYWVSLSKQLPHIL